MGFLELAKIISDERKPHNYLLGRVVLLQFVNHACRGKPYIIA
jgi:hypothetical protein